MKNSRNKRPSKPTKSWRKTNQSKPHTNRPTRADCPAAQLVESIDDEQARILGRMDAADEKAAEQQCIDNVIQALKSGDDNPADSAGLAGPPASAKQPAPSSSRPELKTSDRDLGPMIRNVIENPVYPQYEPRPLGCLAALRRTLYDLTWGCFSCCAPQRVISRPPMRVTVEQLTRAKRTLKQLPREPALKYAAGVPDKTGMVVSSQMRVTEYAVATAPVQSRGPLSRDVRAYTDAVLLVRLSVSDFRTGRNHSEMAVLDLAYQTALKYSGKKVADRKTMIVDSLNNNLHLLPLLPDQMYYLAEGTKLLAMAIASSSMADLNPHQDFMWRTRMVVRACNPLMCCGGTALVSPESTSSSEGCVKESKSESTTMSIPPVGASPPTVSGP